MIGVGLPELPLLVGKRKSSMKPSWPALSKNLIDPMSLCLSAGAATGVTGLASSMSGLLPRTSFDLVGLLLSACSHTNPRFWQDAQVQIS